MSCLRFGRRIACPACPTLIVILAAPLAAEMKAFKGFTLIDGSGRAPVADAAMIVDNGRIQWVGQTAKLNAPAGAEMIDLSGKFVMPGIINLHCHLGNVVELHARERGEGPVHLRFLRSDHRA